MKYQIIIHDYIMKPMTKYARDIQAATALKRHYGSLGYYVEINKKG